MSLKKRRLTKDVELFKKSVEKNIAYIYLYYTFIWYSMDPNSFFSLQNTLKYFKSNKYL